MNFQSVRMKGVPSMVIGFGAQQKASLGLGFVIFFLSTGMGFAEDTKSLTKRLDELEKRQSELFIEARTEKGRVKSFLGETISLGGFFETAVTQMNGRNMGAQISANSNTLGLNVSAEFNEQVRFATQILTALSYPLANPQNDPRANPSSRKFSGIGIGATVAQGYIEYSSLPAFHIQMGLGYVPFGAAFQERELVLFKRRGGPQMLNASSSTGVGIASPLWQGLHAYGSFPVSESNVGYDLYSLTPITNTRSIGGGARLWWSFSDMLTLGVSGQTGKQDGDHFYRSFGGDLRFNYQRFGLTVEYAKNFIASDAISSPSTFYAEPSVAFFEGRFIVYGVADYLDRPNNVSVVSGVVTDDPYKKWELGGGLNWLPLPYTRFRLGYLVNYYVGDTAVVRAEARRYYSADFSAGIAF